LGQGTAPDQTERHRKSETYQQWTAQIQQRLPWEFTSQISYVGMQNYHQFASTPDNVINPLTGKRTLPNFDLVNFKGDWGVGSFHGLMASLQRRARSGLFLATNYTWSHGINDYDTAPQNVACRSCEKARSAYDVRHNFYASLSYPLHLGSSVLLRGWELSGISTIRSGMPLTVTIARNATALPDGNNQNQRPDLIPGVPLTPPGGSTIRQWINPAAFAIPANGKWGSAGRNLLDGPGLFQIDTALSRSVKVTERSNVSLRAEVFNVFNHPQLGRPSLNFSTPATFGRITAVSNTSPIGTGTARSMQLAVRYTF